MAKKKPRPKRASALKTRRLERDVELRALAIDSNFEPATQAAFDYRQVHVYPYLQSKGLAIVRCQGPLARRIYAAPAARRDDVVYVTGVGHGSYTTYTGDQYDPVFEEANYHPDEPKGKIVHFLSCQTAARLGPDFVQDGCHAYFGYDENFTFDPNIADVFFECDSRIDREFADGRTAADVYRRVIDIYNRRISDLDDAGHAYAARLLEFDRNHLRAPSVDPRWGSEQAKIG